MLHIILAVVAVLLVAAVALAYLALVVGDVRRTKGEPLAPNAQRNLEANRQAERRVNEGTVRSGFW